jgi:hypothetical protein
MRLLAQYEGPVRVYQVYRTAPGTAERTHRQPVPPLHRIVRCSDHRDAPGIKETRERCLAPVGWGHVHSLLADTLLDRFPAGKGAMMGEREAQPYRIIPQSDHLSGNMTV